MWHWIIVIVFVALFVTAWWLIFRGVRNYPNLHNLHDDGRET